MIRKFIHCDCDCFFAAIEMRDAPALRGLPVAVGGAEDRRGIIATCNYEAFPDVTNSTACKGSASLIASDIRKMNLLGIDTCEDLQRYTLLQLLEMFGAFGERMRTDACFTQLELKLASSA